MAREFEIKINGIDDFKKVIKKNPQKTKKEVKTFLVKSRALLDRSILRNPWRIGQTSGGAPVDTGNLRDTHQRRITSFSLSIYPTARYAKHVHGPGLGGKKRNKKGIQLRPWLDVALRDNEKAMNDLSEKMLKNLVNNLSK